MRKRQGKTIAKISHVSNSEALNTSIRKFQIKLKNGHGFNENKQEVVKIALEMTKQKQTSHKCESVHICHWQFPRAQGVQAHLLKSTLAKHSHQASKHTEFLTLGSEKRLLQVHRDGAIVYLDSQALVRLHGPSESQSLDVSTQVTQIHSGLKKSTATSTRRDGCKQPTHSLSQ